MSTSPSPTVTGRVHRPGVDASFRTIAILLGCYLALSVATLVAAAFLPDTAGVTSAVWVRAIIVAASAVLTCVFARSAVRGSRRGFLRLRIVSAIMLIAIVVIVALPGAFPVWFRLEQAVCGILLLGVVAQTNGRHLRTVFAR